MFIVVVPEFFLCADLKHNEDQAVYTEQFSIFVKLKKAFLRNGKKSSDCWKDEFRFGVVSVKKEIKKKKKKKGIRGLVRLLSS